MPTENKTANLGLNSWLGTDKPQRADFVEDNTIIDTAITNHLNDFDLHFSSGDRTLLENPFKIGVFAGDGASTQDITFDFYPRIVFVFLRNAPFTEYNSSNGYTKINAAVVASSGGGGTIGVSLFLDTLTVSQSTNASSGRFTNLNANGSQYFYIAFK